jgi:hypothetical protein
LEKQKGREQNEDEEILEVMKGSALMTVRERYQALKLQESIKTW